MTFKDDIVKQEYFKTPLFLRIMADDFDLYCRNNFGIEPVITRVLENITGDSGVHEQNRAVDFRNQHEGKMMFTPEQEAELLKYINEKYARNDGKPTMICHSFGGGPLHFHLQIAAFVSAYVPR